MSNEEARQRLKDAKANATCSDCSCKCAYRKNDRPACAQIIYRAEFFTNAVKG